MAYDPDRTDIAHADRRQQGKDWYEFVMRTPGPPSDIPYQANGILDFVFSEMWSRPGLDMRSRRWITLACVCAAGTIPPIESHIYAALKSGDCTYEEMSEFVLHFAVYLGWPKASIVQITIGKMWQKVQAEGGPEMREQPARNLEEGDKALDWQPRSAG